LLGRHENGKSNVLRALHSLNPANGFKALSPIKDFPRHRKLSECTEQTPVVDTTWQLTAYDLGQSLFLGSNNLIVEGVTDFWIFYRRYRRILATKAKSVLTNVSLSRPLGVRKKFTTWWRYLRWNN
jgi:hypothetical protein